MLSLSEVPLLLVMGPLLAVLLSMWAEAIGYGFFLCLLTATVYIHFSDALLELALAGPRSSRRNGMLYISTLMFVVASLHLGVSSYRSFNNFVNAPLVPPPSAVRWNDQVTASMYVTQELLGSGAALYRCWLLWNKDWRIVVVPTLLFLCELGIGYVPCSFYAKSEGSVMDPRIFAFITSFYSLAVVTNITTTGLMTYRLWKTYRSSHIVTRSVFVPIMWIMVESAMLQLVVEAILLILFLVNSSAQYVFFGLVVPIIGITFTAITVRIKLVSANALRGSARMSSAGSSSGMRYPQRTEESRRVEILTNITSEEDMFRTTSDSYKTQMSTGEHSRTQQE